MSQGLDAFRQMIREHALLASETFEPWQSFWYHRPTRNFPPPAIREPAQWQGGTRLALACTQTDLKPAAQKKLVAEWCERLPTLGDVKFLWLQSRCPQELFAAACAMPGLDGLYVKWGPLTDLTPITARDTLRYLHLGSAPALAPLEALAALPALEWLELANVRALVQLDFLRALPQLRGLALAGDGNSIKYVFPETLAPLAALQQLEWLSLTTLGVRDESLAPLAALPKLRHLHLGNSFRLDEVASLAGRRPDIDCPLFAPHGEPANWTSCKQCREKTMVMVIGKGKPWLCTRCDAPRLARHVAEFERLRQAAAGA